MSAQDKEDTESGEGRTRRFAPADLRQATRVWEAGYAYSGGRLGASGRQARRSGAWDLLELAMEKFGKSKHCLYLCTSVSRVSARDSYAQNAVISKYHRQESR